ncbi:MAG: type IV pilus secretin PilQ family protein [Lysobacteraceae bacterium]|nr:MAG: type IV pilus secretin PilQ family protein [Xanthomonadaceae bacterium]
MIVLNAHSQHLGRRKSPVRAGLFGLAAGLLSALSAVNAAPPAQPASAPAVVAAPAASAAKAPGIASIDFKRGDGGSGKLILRFDGDGATPDLRTQSNGVVVEIGNATLPAHLQRTLNVTDFATPVQQIQASGGDGKARLTLSANGAFEPLAYQTGRDYIVELVPRTPAPTRAVGAAAATSAQQKSATSAPRAYAGRPVTFNFQDVPVRTVLQLIAEESGLNIVASDTVQGNVTLRLINVPWDQALDIVLQAKALDKRRNGNVVWVAPQSEIAKFEQEKEDARIAIENRTEMVTEYIPVSYGNAEDIAKLLTDESKTSSSGGGGASASAGATSLQNRGFLSSRGSISFDRRTNTLLVIDIPQRVAEIRRLVNQLDKPVDQVLIEAKIVIATEDFARELGAKFGINGSKDNVTFGNNIANTSATRNSIISTETANLNAIRQWEITNLERAARGEPPIPPPVLGNHTISKGNNVDLGATVGSLITSNPASLAFTILNAGYYLDLELSAMQEEGRGEVISNPRVVTSNQREAVIKQGREIGYVTTQATGGVVTQTVNFKDVVLELKVTPTITNDGRVFLSMAVKKDELEEFIQTINGSVPLIAKREVNTAVLVDDGNTVVIGGVYEFQDRSQASKVPFLADLPVLGNLFKKKGRGKTKAELLIFVTPKVLPVAQRRV